ncbi:uncharacterized protein [Medicago truncatula]|uniref:Nodule-specific cysteine-rich peptide 334 n=1 Tax=Medicago truncatula TaxID=3880 RepID=A7KHG4_MEDTR|nr:uncharacterized protein LOC11435466 [Medicago truncatula]ABS31471.1 nodule-specific cysteine-rich peptide 334 [Medicago truncatula]
MLRLYLVSYFLLKRTLLVSYFSYFSTYIIECKTDNDCPISQLKIYAWKCVKNGCHLFDVIPMMYE